MSGHSYSIDRNFQSTLPADLTDEAGNHNSHFFNISMGAFTDAISANIRNGSFKNVFPGKFFDFSDVPYSYLDENNATHSSTYGGRIRFWDLDYHIRCGDTDLSTHHVLAAPDTPMYYVGMNDDNTTAGSYVGSKMLTKHLRRAEAIFKA